LLALFAQANGQSVVDINWTKGFSDPSARFLSTERDTVLNFSWGGFHNVHVFTNRAAYDSCDFSSASLIPGGGTSPVSYIVTEETFFACKVSSHCRSGQKLEVTVSIPSTSLPTLVPTFPPTKSPSESPVFNPTPDPTKEPTRLPTLVPTFSPTKSPSESQVFNPTSDPTKEPTRMIKITNLPTVTQSLTLTPTFGPTLAPTLDPTPYPTFDPTPDPSFDPTSAPTFDPTPDPTFDPTSGPTKATNYASDAPSMLSSAPVSKIVKTVDISWVAGFSDESVRSRFVEKDTVLTFSWMGYHNVWKFSDKESFDSCDFSAAEEIPGGSLSPVSYTITETAYFACKVIGHCDGGQKLEASTDSKAPTFTPTLSPTKPPTTIIPSVTPTFNPTTITKSPTIAPTKTAAENAEVTDNLSSSSFLLSISYHCIYPMIYMILSS